MTQEDKELLLKDLCARLPYNVICQVEFKLWNYTFHSKVMLLSGIFTDEAYFTTKGGSIYSNEYKPYLFPMSSMTEEEKLMYEGLMTGTDNISYMLDVIDWLNIHHFDYRGLIEKGLAIDATGLNIY